MGTATAPTNETVEHEAGQLPDAIKLHGRTFRRATSTSVDQDAYVTKRLRDSGLSGILDEFDPAKDDIAALNERIIWEAFERGVMYEVLAGILVEDGVPWSRATAAKNAKMMAEITDQAEKAPILSSAADFLFDFFAVAAAWSARSMSLLTDARPTTTSGEHDEPGDDGIENSARQIPESP